MDASEARAIASEAAQQVRAFRFDVYLAGDLAMMEAAVASKIIDTALSALDRIASLPEADQRKGGAS